MEAFTNTPEVLPTETVIEMILKFYQDRIELVKSYPKKEGHFRHVVPLNDELGLNEEVYGIFMIAICSDNSVEILNMRGTHVNPIYKGDGIIEINTSEI